MDEAVDAATTEPTLIEALAVSRSDGHAHADGARRELRCAGCGFGAITVEPPERCPMCGVADWLAV